MTFKTAVAATCLAGAMVCGAAQAGVATFSGSGYGISVSGQLTYATDPYAGAGDPASAVSVTGASGLFSDSNIGMSDWAITGVYPTSPNPANYPFPTSMSFLAASGPAIPALDGGALSFDNLLYIQGSPDVCGDGQQGGALDVMGLMLEIQAPVGGQTAFVDIWSDGSEPIAGYTPVGDGIYGAAVISSANVGLDYQDPQTPPDASPGVTLAVSVPEPASWALMLAGLAPIGATLRRRKPAAC